MRKAAQHDQLLTGAGSIMTTATSPSKSHGRKTITCERPAATASTPAPTGGHSQGHGIWHNQGVGTATSVMAPR